MKLSLQSACQLAFLTLCCVLTTVRLSESSYVPARCICLQTQPYVRGQLKNLTIYPKRPGCDKKTVIVTLKSNNEDVCLSPTKPMGKQLICCWNRAQELGGDVSRCLRGKLRRRLCLQFRQKSRGQSRKATSS